jgi:hypothetical protein
MRFAVKRACNHHQGFVGECTAAAKVTADIKPAQNIALLGAEKIVAPYPRRREINRPDHVAAFKVE